ncbi:MAG: HEPN domain-containing protein [Candidatus Bathyarchaeia archaeon]
MSRRCLGRARSHTLGWWDSQSAMFRVSVDFSGGRPNWALFAPHQTVEKALKAAHIVLKRERPPRTYDLVELYRSLGVDLSERLTEALSELTPYCSAARYPNAGLQRHGWEYPSLLPAVWEKPPRGSWRR